MSSSHETSHNGSEFLFHVACESCGSSDANSVYDDGHLYCYSCGTYTPGEGEPKHEPKPTKNFEPLTGEILPLPARKVSQETCEKFGYFCTEFSGKQVQVAPYYDSDRRLVAQKLRFPNKEFTLLGSLNYALPFGAQAWQKSGKKIVVTEGEIDALAMSQVQGNSWPTVSVPNGSTGALKFIARNLEYFREFEEVVLMFDNDKPGILASKECAGALGHRASIASLPLKDAGDMLVAGRVKELLNSMWRAVKWTPEGIVNLADTRDEVLKVPEHGLSWPFESLTALTYGIRLGEIYAFGAGTGIGKTDFFAETIRHIVETHAVPVGVFSLEQQPVETARRIVGKMIEKPIHIPDCDYTAEEVDAAFDTLAKRVFLYDSFGINNWPSIREKIEYLRHAEDVRYFFLDHLTALAASEDNERIALDKIMADMGGLVKKLNITIFLVSHLATPDGKAHEEGGRVMIRHFRGSRSIGFWCHYIFGMERDQQADDISVRKITTFRVLKDRYTGKSTGAKFYFTYDHDTGKLYECSSPDTPKPFDGVFDGVEVPNTKPGGGLAAPDGGKPYQF